MKMEKARKAIERKEIAEPEDFEGFLPGHNACAGCGASIAMRHITKAVGRNAVYTIATGCMEVVSTSYPLTSWDIPIIHSAFENAGATASGIEAALKHLGRNERVIAIAGDGGTYDIGLQALSGALERGHDILFICYDNEAYMNCLSLDSLIITEEGLKRITEVREGDKVYAFDQNNHNLILKRCTGVFNNGIKRVYELNTLHHTIKATSNHPFLVVKRGGRGKGIKLVWKTLAELTTKDEIIVSKRLKDEKSYKFPAINLSKKGDYKANKINDIKIPEISSPELMEFLGIYVGDGWIRAYKPEIGFAVPENSWERRRLKELYDKVFNKEFNEKDKNYVYIYSVNLSRFIDSLGFGSGARNKIIPSWVFTLPQEEKEAFVRGLMLSDGYKVGESNRYVSASFDLLRTLRLLLQTIGYRVGKIHQQTKKKGTFVVYRKLLEDSNYGYICFSKKKKANTEKYLSQTKQRDFLADNEYFSSERIVSIKFVKEEPTLDLRVEGEHNFIADGIVVHNTGIQRSGSTPLYAETTTSPYGDKIHGKVEWKKQLPFIAASHKCYVATANIAFMDDFYAKIRKALSIKGPKFIQVLTPCVIGWRIQSNEGVEIARLAVQTGIAPLYEIENGVLKFNMDIKTKHVEEYLLRQGRFKHLNKKEILEIQERVDREYSRLKYLSDNAVRVF